VKKVKLQYGGDAVYRGADDVLQVSLTCDPGDVVEVSPEKAKELLEDKDSNWKEWKPRPSAASRGVPGGASRAPSSAGGAGGAGAAGGAPSP
jgi:hypothetical protein